MMNKNKALGLPGRGANVGKHSHRKYSTNPTRMIPEGAGWTEPFDDLVNFLVDDFGLPIAEYLPRWLPAQAVEVITRPGRSSVIFFRKTKKRRRAGMRRARLADYPWRVTFNALPDVGTLATLAHNGEPIVTAFIAWPEWVAIALAVNAKWGGGGGVCR